MKSNLLAVCAVTAVTAFVGCGHSITMTGEMPKSQMGMEVGQMGDTMSPSMSSKNDDMMAPDMQPKMDEKMSPKMDDPEMKK